MVYGVEGGPLLLGKDLAEQRSAHLANQMQLLNENCWVIAKQLADAMNVPRGWSDICSDHSPNGAIGRHQLK